VVVDGAPGVRGELPHLLGRKRTAAEAENRWRKTDRPGRPTGSPSRPESVALVKKPWLHLLGAGPRRLDSNRAQ